MSALDLSNLRGGFAHEAYGSQAVFRIALEASAHPGRVSTMPAVSQLPRTGHGAAAALLLALLDADCTLWTSASLAHSDALEWLRFHTGCRPVDDASAAQFVWVASGDAVPDLRMLQLGSDDAPDGSATCIIEVQELSEVSQLRGVPAWTLSGPGIRGAGRVSVRGICAGFVSQRADIATLFPRGVDVFLASPAQLMGLPRTTQITSGQ